MGSSARQPPASGIVDALDGATIRNPDEAEQEVSAALPRLSR